MAVRAVITTLRRRRAPGDAELLAFKDGGEWVDVRTDDVNDYVQALIGEEFSAKDFRTWVGTVLVDVDVELIDRAKRSNRRARRIRRR